MVRLGSFVLISLTSFFLLIDITQFAGTISTVYRGGLFGKKSTSKYYIYLSLASMLDGLTTEAEWGAGSGISIYISKNCRTYLKKKIVSNFVLTKYCRMDISHAFNDCELYPIGNDDISTCTKRSGHSESPISSLSRTSFPPNGRYINSFNLKRTNCTN
jgi:hypothetical protein